MNRHLDNIQQILDEVQDCRGSEVFSNAPIYYDIVWEMREYLNKRNPQYVGTLKQLPDAVVVYIFNELEKGQRYDKLWVL